MEEIAKYFAISLPFFLAAVLSEKLYGYLKGNDTVPFMDAISSGYSGITMLMKQLLGLSITLISYSFLVNHISVFTVEANWVNYGIAFIALDFSFYWGHRVSHRVNYFWNVHLIHHSSEEFNLACALRQAISDFIHAFTIFLIPAAVLGVPEVIIVVVAPLHTLLQYWYHTRVIGKLGFLEYIIVTPSQHRVHHAMNPLYLDKNYSAIFCFWDRLFGTFQEELASEPPVYGITRPAQTYNPITINFQHLILMIKDAWHADKWVDKLTIWFRPTGWRPQGFEEKYVVTKITDVHNFEKFNPHISTPIFWWSLVQFFILFGFFFYVLLDIAPLGVNGLFIFALFVFVQVYSATELMNRNKLSPLYSFISTLVCFAIYFFDSSWFGMSNVFSLFPSVFLVYFFLQTILAFTFSKKANEFSFAKMQSA
jgi:alkylglycerol monooxygenase